MDFKPYFNGQITKDNAYNNYKTMTEILDLFKKFRDQPDVYDVEQNARESMAVAVDKAVTTSGAGSGKSCFLPIPFEVKYQDKKYKLQNLYDIVGWIFSVVGKTPDNATDENYFLPLLGLYQLFLRRLLEGKTRVPRMVQLTYFSQTIGNAVVNRVCLGSTLDNPAKDTKTDAQKNREEQMVDHGQITTADKGTTLITDTAHGMEKSLFGHCAETFPFLFVRGAPNVDADSVGGFAGKMDIPFGKIDSAYNEQQVKNNRVVPCKNCEYLVGNNVNWDLMKFRFGTPIPPTAP